MGILNLISDTRRSHALEHATVQILNRRIPTASLAGRSMPNGFLIYGNVSTAEINAAVAEALARLKRGDHHLAVHPRCGTNLVTAGTLVGLVSFLTMLPGDERSRRDRLPLLLLLTTLTLLLVQPLGPFVQRYITTEANLAQTTVIAVRSRKLGTILVHQILLDHRSGA